MDKKRFLDILESLKIDNPNDFAYEVCLNMGIEEGFKHLTEDEVRFAAKYLLRYPHIYYNRYAKCIYGVEIFKKGALNEEVKKLNLEYHKHFYEQYVGIFFVIGKTIKTLKMNVADLEPVNSILDIPVSHFTYGKKLGLDDYGHYPRGRVIYDFATNTFYIYIDKSLSKDKSVIEEVRKCFNIGIYNYEIKTDEHYTHDNL